MHKLKLGFNFLFMYDNPSSMELIITALKVDTVVSVWQKRIHTVCKPNDRFSTQTANESRNVLASDTDGNSITKESFALGDSIIFGERVSLFHKVDVSVWSGTHSPF